MHTYSEIYKEAAVSLRPIGRMATKALKRHGKDWVQHPVRTFARTGSSALGATAVGALGA